MALPQAFRKALKEYGRTIKKNGWRAGEPLIKKYKKQWPEFSKWARALAIMLRAIELLEENKNKPR